MLKELLDPRLIVADLAATTKAGVLEELSALVSERAGGAGLDKAALLQVLLERERLGSTGIGEGVALPHGKLAGLDRLLLGCARSRAGIDFDSADEQPARLFFLLLSPEGETAHLRALAALAKLLRESSVRRGLLDAASAEEMYEALQRAVGQC